MMVTKKWLGFAIETEERGIRFYKKALKSTKEKDAKILFSLLLDQEQRHREILMKLDENPEEMLEATEELEEVKMKNTMFEGEQIHDKDLMELFNEAMDFEREGYSLYRDISEKIQENKGKEFFKE